MEGLLSPPAVGFGCSPLRGDQVLDLGQAIEWALELGYRLFDTAEVYGNERQLGRCIRRFAGLRRNQVIVISKVWQTNHAYGHVIAACEASLGRLGLDQLDLYLVHSPEAWGHTGPLGEVSEMSLSELESRALPRDDQGEPMRIEVPLAETWSAMETLVQRGLVRSIGVSNFRQEHLEELARTASIAPAVHQIACHPYRPARALSRYCEQENIALIAHSPLSSPGLLEDPVLRRIARRVGKSVAQVLLRWYLERGILPVVSSAQRHHLAENLEILDFGLHPADTEAIGELAREAEDATDA